jgi:hypothetical protein
VLSTLAQTTEIHWREQIPEHWRKKPGLWPGATWFDGVEGSHSAAKELREGIEGKLTEKIDLTVDVNRDVVERLQAERNRLAKRETPVGTTVDASNGKVPSSTG